MFEHHRAALDAVVAKLSADPHVDAILLAGSVAHGTATESSDVDILIVLDEAEYARRQASGDLLYFDRESCAYEGGYIDGKYLDRDFLRLVAEKGSEPARHAFRGASVVFSRTDGIPELFAAASRYPEERREERLKSFWAQVCAWRWYHAEGARSGNEYLVAYSATNFVLFVGRLLLAHNRVLYPDHKWLTRTLDGVADKPAGVIEMMEAVLRRHDAASIDRLYEAVHAMGPWGMEDWEWANYFVRDTEQTWLRGEPFISEA
ncbi:MAG: nucleotidyltransferase domain-containing protein [Candidatus Limnocylindrales bacterium]